MDEQIQTRFHIAQVYIKHDCLCNFVRKKKTKAYRKIFRVLALSLEPAWFQQIKHNVEHLKNIQVVFSLYRLLREHATIIVLLPFVSSTFFYNCSNRWIVSIVITSTDSICIVNAWFSIDRNSRVQWILIWFSRFCHFAIKISRINGCFFHPVCVVYVWI